MKKYWNLDFLMPILWVYVVCFVPLMAVRVIGNNGNMMSWSLYGGTCVLATWWVMVYFDGTIKSAQRWILRYYISIVPAIIASYVMVLCGFIYFPELLLCVGISILTNQIMGLIAYGIRKKTGDVMLVFVVVVLLYLCLNPYQNSLLGRALWGFI